MSLLQICEQQTGDGQCILCGTSFAMDVELIAHLVVAHQHDIDLKSTQQQTVFQALPFLFTCLFKYLRSVFANDGDLPASSVSSGNTVPGSHPEGQSTISRAPLTTRKRQVNGHSGPYKECKVNASFSKNEVSADLRQTDYFDLAWQPRVEIKRCRLSNESRGISPLAVSHTTGVSTVVGTKTGKPKIVKAGRKRKLHNITRARTTSKFSGRNTSSSAPLYQNDAVSCGSLQNVIGSIETKSPDHSSKNEHTLTPETATSIDVGNSSASESATESVMTSSQFNMALDVDSEARLLQVDQATAGSDDASSLKKHNSQKSQHSYEYFGDSLHTGPENTVISHLLKCIKVEPELKAAASDACDVTHSSFTAMPSEMYDVDNSNVACNTSPVVSTDVFETRQPGAEGVEGNDVTADDNDDMTKHATSDLTDHIATDVAAEDAVDNLFDDAVSDVSSVISTVSMEYVPNNALSIETGSLRSHRAQSIEAADESFLRNQGNYLV